MQKDTDSVFFVFFYISVLRTSDSRLGASEVHPGRFGVSLGDRSESFFQKALGGLLSIAMGPKKVKAASLPEFGVTEKELATAKEALASEAETKRQRANLGCLG